MNYLPKITVAIRKRPLSQQELQRKDKDIINVTSPSFLEVCELRHKVDLSKYIEKHQFQFDATFNEECTNEQLYQVLVQPLIMLAFDGSKVNCFAYGQTGSGKTYTMMGISEDNISGLYLLAAQDVFQLLKQDEYQHLVIGISFYEIYCGKAYDLLNDREKCPIRVDAKENVNIVGLNEKLISNTESLMALINYGQTVRRTGQTGMNDTSSRSHAILTINLRDQYNGKVQGKMTFIDLAGSERGADVTDTNKQTRQDGAEINKSLLALKECIRAMDQDKKHLPFRGSKLTLVLKDSFIGKCKTVMIGTVSPGNSSCEHTLNTLRYADRVKELKKKNKKMSKEDKLSQQLMLPRQKQNSNMIDIKESNNKSVVFSQFDAKKKEQESNLNIEQQQKVTQNSFKKQNNFINKRLSDLQHTQQQRQPLFRQKNRNTFLKQSSLKDQQSNNNNKIDNNFEIEDSENDNNNLDIEEDSFLKRVSEQQDDLIEEHSNHIDNIVSYIKQDMNLLQNIKSQPTQMIEYIEISKRLLDNKIQSIYNFKMKLEHFEQQFKKLEQMQNQEEEEQNDYDQEDYEDDEEEEELFEIEEYKKDDGLLDGL